MSYQCNALVTIQNGIIKTESCQTKQYLVDLGSSSDGERDYYRCPDCGQRITIDYREN